MEPLKYVGIFKRRGSSYQFPISTLASGISASLSSIPERNRLWGETGFVSRKNPDPTAKNLLELMERNVTQLFWNGALVYRASAIREAFSKLCPTS